MQLTIHKEGVPHSFEVHLSNVSNKNQVVVIFPMEDTMEFAEVFGEVPDIGTSVMQRLILSVDWLSKTNEEFPTYAPGRKLRLKLGAYTEE